MTRCTRPFCDDSRCRLNRAVDSRPASKRNLLLSGRPGRATSPSWDLGIRTPYLCAAFSGTWAAGDPACIRMRTCPLRSP